MQISAFVPEIFKPKNCVKHANEMAETSYSQPNIHQLYKQRYLGQFAKETIETWQANSSLCHTLTAVKRMATHFFPGPSNLISTFK